jgi:hypothetical protein
MIQTYCDSWLHAATMLGQVIHALRNAPNVPPFSPKNVERLGVAIALVRNNARPLGMRSVLNHCDRIMQHLEGGGVMNDPRFRELLVGLLERAEDELKQQRFMAIRTEELGYFEPSSPPWGDEIDQAFPDLSEDICEAAKCIALNRSTASVFHLMRVMESVVPQMARHLGIERIAGNWGVILGQMDAVTAIWPKGHIAVKPWSESRNLLYHVKNAWRNDTMHPKRTYTDNEAMTIFAAVRLYLEDLADVMKVPLP